MYMFIPLCTPILIRFPYPQPPIHWALHPSVAPKERPWQVGARPGQPRFRPRPKRCAPAGFLVTPGSHPWRSVDSFFCMLYTYHMYY